MGATTIWERWDSMLPDGTINPGQMTSFNHYALGAVADWMHQTIGGCRPLEPGYAKVLIAPQPGGGLTWARTSLETRHGPVVGLLAAGRQPAASLSTSTYRPRSARWFGCRTAPSTRSAAASTTSRPPDGPAEIGRARRNVRRR